MKNITHVLSAYLGRKLFLTLALFFALLTTATAQIIINPGATQCDSGRDGIRTEIGNNGSIKVYYRQYGEFYGFMTTYFRVDNATTQQSTACSASTVTGGGTTADPYVVLLTHQISGVTITQKVSYVYPDRYFMMDFEVIAGATAIADVSVFIRQDTAPGGDDYGVSTADATINPTRISSYRTSAQDGSPKSILPYSCGLAIERLPASTVWKTSAGGFTSFAAGHYSTNCSAPTATQTNFSNHLSAPTLVEDVGLAGHWNLGNFTPRESKTKRVLVGFGDSFSDFDGVAVVDPAPLASGSIPVNVSFSSATFNVNEGDVDNMATTIKATISGGVLSSPQTVKISATNGTATASDYEFVGNAFTIPTGNYMTPQEIVIDNIKIKGNTIVQANRTFTITLDPVPCGALAVPSGTTNATITIVDDDTPTVSLLKKDNLTTCSTSTNVFDVVLSKAISTPTTVTLTLSGTSVASNFSAMLPTGWYSTGTVVIPANTASVPLYLTATTNNLVEGVRSLTATVSGAVSGVMNLPIATAPANTATASIADCDDGAILVEKYKPLPGTTDASEPSTNGSFLIRFANSAITSASATKVGITVSASSTAVSGVDYEPISATYVTILATQNGVELPVTVKNNNIVQGKRRLELTITGIIP